MLKRRLTLAQTNKTNVEYEYDYMQMRLPSDDEASMLQQLTCYWCVHINSITTLPHLTPCMIESGCSAALVKS